MRRVLRKFQSMTDSARFRTVSYFSLSLIGLILGLYIVGDFDFNELAALLGVGVAGSLIASGISGLFVQLIIAPQAARTVTAAVRSVVGHPARVLDERQHLNREFSELTEKGDNIDLISLTLTSFTENTHRKKLYKWIARGRKHIRIMLLSPDSIIGSRRGEDEGGVDLSRKIKESITRLSIFCEYARVKSGDGQKLKGSLEVRVFDSIPYFAYLRCDNVVMIGFYYSHVPGIQSEVLRIEESSHPVLAKTKRHFEKVWSSECPRLGTGEERRVCCIRNGEVSFNPKWTAEPELPKSEQPEESQKGQHPD